MSSWIRQTIEIDVQLSRASSQARWVARRIEGVEIYSGRTTTQDIVAESAVHVSGRVLDADGEPVPQASL
ncbi:MAG: hypothetical protein AAF961_18900 [Planctomycetota bacterium]